MDNLLEQGIAAYKAGKRDEAREIFIALVKQIPDSEPTWGWMYQASNNDQERIHCLKQILRINPSSEKAKQLLDALTGQDFPFDLPQKTTPPMQEQVSNVSPVASTKNQETQNQATKKCPFCAELIQSDAIVCRFCGHDLSPQPKIAPQVNSPQSIKHDPIKKRNPYEQNIIFFVILIGGVGILLIFLVGLMMTNGSGGTKSGGTKSNSAKSSSTYYEVRYEVEGDISSLHLLWTNTQGGMDNGDYIR